MKVHFILYVKDQMLSTKFYVEVLMQEPTLCVPGMTEFTLSDGCILGLMPERGIKKLLGEILPDPEAGSGIPRAEIYILVEDPGIFHQRALKRGAKELSGLALRDWGHSAAYSLDPDGHVLVFAKAI